MDILASTFEKAVGRAPEASKLNTFMLDAFEDKLPDVSADVLTEFLKKKSYIPDTIDKHADKSLLFRTPAVLIIYFRANPQPHETKRPEHRREEKGWLRTVHCRRAHTQ